MGEARISGEAALLLAISDDDAESVRRLLIADAPVAKLLRLRVKPTFNDVSDESAFFHSVASFGLTFALGDSMVDLAERNGCVEAARVLREAARAEGVVTVESRIAAEAALLSAIANDDAHALRDALSGNVPSYDIMRLVVKGTFNDPSDDSSFFHSVASYGLQFVLGDTAEQLAQRNGRVKVAAALNHFSMSLLDSQSPSPSNINVVVSNAASGDLVAEIIASTSWTLGMLQGAMHKPLAGCWRFLSKSSPLTPGIRLVDLCQGDGETLRLTAILVPVVTGTYHAHATSLTPGRRGREHRGKFRLDLKEGDALTLELETTRDGPLPCANRPPPLLHINITFEGTWSSDPPGIIATCNQCHEVSSRGMGRREETTTLELDLKLKMILVQEGHLEVVERILTGIDARMFPNNFCSVGTVFVKGQDDV